MPDADSQEDIKIVDEEEVIQRQIVRHALWSSKISTLLAVSVVISYAILGAAVLVLSFVYGKEAPSWAMAVESSAITAAIAVVFKSHIPSE